MPIEIRRCYCIQFQKIFGDTGSNNFATMLTCLGANINQIICSKHNVLIMFNNNNTVANIAQII